MNLKYLIKIILFSFITFISCIDENELGNSQGYLELGVSKNVEVITRGFDVEDQSLSVDICSDKDGSVVKHFSDYNDMAGERVLLEVGSYTIKVKSNPISKLDFDKPTFYGEKANVSVKAGKTTSTSVECSLSCVKVTTEFTKPVKEKFESITARISDSSSSYLDYSMEETRAGYFQPGFLLVDLTLTNKEGLEFKMSKLIENTEERDYYHLIFDLIDSGDNNSGMDFDISIETNPTNDEEHTVTVPLPGTGYEQDPPVVKVTENGVEGDGIISIDKGDETSLLFETSSTNIGLKSVFMLTSSIDFEKNEIPLSLDLMNLSEENKVKLQNVNLSPVISEDKTSLRLDYSALISILSGGTHTFILSAVDLMGHETIQKITININLSIMTVKVHNADVWAHYATLCGYIKNAKESEKGSYKFQYRLKRENEWSDVSGNVNILENIGSNGENITQVVTNLNDNSEYEYRILFNETAAEPLSFITEEAIPLTNGDFEDNNNGPWNTGENSFWSSGNNTFVNDLCVRKTDNGNNSYAYLKSKNAAGKFAAGNAFTGSFELKILEMNGIVTLGKTFNGRPYSLKGIYNYIPQQVTNGGNKIPNGSIDQCSIYIILLTDKIVLNPADATTLDWKNKYAEQIIALAELPTEEDMTTDGFESFELKLEYLKKDVDPKYIGVLATSSKYGDYFQGAVGSELSIDNFELVYSKEPDILE